MGFRCLRCGGVSDELVARLLQLVQIKSRSVSELSRLLKQPYASVYAVVLALEREGLVSTRLSSESCACSGKVKEGKRRVRLVELPKQVAKEEKEGV